MKIGVVSEEKYNTIRACLCKSLNIPLKQRTVEQKRAAFLYKRWSRHFGLTPKQKVTFDGKLVVKEGELTQL